MHLFSHLRSLVFAGVAVGGLVFNTAPVDAQCRTIETDAVFLDHGFHDYGRVIDRDGDVAVIGTAYDSDVAINAGAAVIYHRVGGQWMYQQTLRPDDLSTQDAFGSAVAISGEIGDLFGSYVEIEDDVILVDALEKNIFPTPPGTGRVSRYVDNGGGFQLDGTFVGGVPGDYNYSLFGVGVNLENGEALLGSRVQDQHTGDVSAVLMAFDVGCGVTCDADIANNDGLVDVSDLFTLLSNWGQNGPGADVASPTNMIDVSDLFQLLSGFGACP